jgi:hypothetical protein
MRLRELKQCQQVCALLIDVCQCQVSMKNSDDIIGNRNRDLPACSAVPQPTAPHRAPGTPEKSL